MTDRALNAGDDFYQDARSGLAGHRQSPPPGMDRSQPPTQPDASDEMPSDGRQTAQAAPSREFYRALGMTVALSSYSLATAADQRKIAEDIAATIEAFAREPAPELLTAQTDTASS